RWHCRGPRPNSAHPQSRSAHAAAKPAGRGTDRYRHGHLAAAARGQPFRMVYRISSRYLDSDKGYARRAVRLLRLALLADKASLQLGEPPKRSVGQRTLVDRARGVFELVERRVADEHGRYGVVGDRKAQCRVDQALGMAFADQRLEPLCPRYI